MSVALHGALLGLLVFYAPSSSNAVSDGKPVQAIEVYMVPGDKPGQSAAGAETQAEAVEQASPTGQQEAVASQAPGPQPTADTTDGDRGGASAPSAGAYAQSADYSAFRHRLLNHIRPHQFYPDPALPDRLKGVVHVGFAMQRDGTILEIWVETSSGYALLDQAALDTVRRAQPLPMVPTVLPSMMDVMLPIGFSPPHRYNRG